MRFSAFPAVVVFAALSFFTSARAEERREPYECRFAQHPVKIDGKLDEEAWKDAAAIAGFSIPWKKGNPAAKSATEALVLWDRDYFYFAAKMRDADLFATIKEHDGETWNDDVFEIFFKPADDKPGYYEFQVNAAGTVLDMFLPRRNAGGYRRFARDGEFHVETAVAHQGTLNQWRDVDEGWTVEGRIPWSDFTPTGGRPTADEVWKFTLCRYDYTVDREGPELSTIAPLSVPDFHHFEDYASLKFVGPKLLDKQGAAGKSNRLVTLKESFGKVPSHVVGTPDPPPPMKVVRTRPEVKLSFPICVTAVPTSDRFLFLDKKWSYGPARLACTTDEPGKLATLIELPAAYSIEFDPRFAENGFIYVGWNGAVGSEKKRSYVTRYTLDPKPPHALRADSALNILEWESDGHNGAALAFGLDGLLYVTTGDGTSDSDTNLAGQRLDHLLGKVLRIDVGHATAERPYSVPADNPFVTDKAARPETWCLGLRNPWRMTVDPKTGDLWVGNNGQDLWEQVYLIERGANYGWSAVEGSHPFYPDRAHATIKISPPTFEHHHSEARSLTGGVVYHGQKWPELRGAYLYGDYSTGKIWTARVAGGKMVEHREIADTTLQITSFALDHGGEVLITDHRGNEEGGLYTLERSTPAAAATAFPRKLSETGLFVDVPRHRVHPGLLPYSVNAPLWSDGAFKERYLFLPAVESTPISLEIDEGDRGWNLPDGTVAVKSFALEMKAGDPASRRWVETRLMVKDQGEWQGYSYRWNDEQTEATLVERQGTDVVFKIDEKDQVREQTWHFPTRTECMVCHSRAANFVLGLSTLQMNREHTYGEMQVNQLEVLEALGLLKFKAADAQAPLREVLTKAERTGKELEEQLKLAAEVRAQRVPRETRMLPKSPSRLAKLVDPYDRSQDLAARAKSYLHANCAQCHVEAGGGNAQMQLSWSTPLDKMKVLDVPPLHHKYGVDEPRLIAAGRPEQSVLLHRLSIRGSGQMPQLATNVVDHEAVALIREWIAKLPAETGKEEKAGR